MRFRRGRRRRRMRVRGRRRFLRRRGSAGRRRGPVRIGYRFG